MRKHPLVKNMRKLNFHLVPMTGVAKRAESEKKFRAEFVRGSGEGDNRGVLGVNEILSEAIEAHRLTGISPEMLRLYVEAVLQTMIDKTVEDGRTRRFDDYLSVSLKIHGGFKEKSDDYDFDRHSLALTVQALNAFRPNLSSFYPVNVNRRKQFRLSYVTAADGKHGNHEIVYGQDFIIDGLTPCSRCTSIASARTSSTPRTPRLSPSSCPRTNSARNFLSLPLRFATPETGTR